VDGPREGNAKFIQEALQDFLMNIKRTKKQTGLFGAVKWALKDKKIFFRASVKAEGSNREA